MSGECIGSKLNDQQKELENLIQLLTTEEDSIYSTIEEPFFDNDTAVISVKIVYLDSVKELKQRMLEILKKYKGKFSKVDQRGMSRGKKGQLNSVASFDVTEIPSIPMITWRDENEQKRPMPVDCLDLRIDGRHSPNKIAEDFEKLLKQRIGHHKEQGNLPKNYRITNKTKSRTDNFYRTRLRALGAYRLLNTGRTAEEVLEYSRERNCALAGNIDGIRRYKADATEVLQNLFNAS